MMLSEDVTKRFDSISSVLMGGRGAVSGGGECGVAFKGVGWWGEGRVYVPGKSFWSTSFFLS